MNAMQAAATRNDSHDAHALLATRIAIPVLSCFLGALLANWLGAVIGVVIALATIFRATLWRPVRAAAPLILQRLAGYLPLSVSALFDRRRAP